MRTLFIIILGTLISCYSFAQTDSLINEIEMEVDIQETPEIPFVIDEEVEVVRFYEDSLSQNETDSIKKERIQIRIGNHNIEITTQDKETQVDVKKIEVPKNRWENHSWDDEDETIYKHHKPKKQFDGHWGSFDFGVNMLPQNEQTYENYPAGTPDFLAIRPEKSFECNINLFEYSFGFGSYVGIVTGLGFNFNDYKFRNNYTIKGIDGKLQPVELPTEDLRLTKLSTGYVTAPLMLEIQIPGNGGKDRLFIAGGLIGGLKMGEHTKYKIGKDKLKSKGDHYVAPLRWGYTARVGFEDLGVFANYYVTELFEKGKGPVTNPFTVGLTLTF